MSGTTDAEAFRKFTNDLRNQAGVTESKPKFDADGFERLRNRLRTGI